MAFYKDHETIGADQNCRWWEDDLDDVKRSEAAFSAFRLVEGDDRARIEDYKRFTRIYENRDYLGLTARSLNTRRADGGSVLNISKQVVDTIAARIAKSRPHARFQTEGSNQSLRRKAKLQERWVEAEQYRAGVESEGPDVFIDAAVYGTGIFHHFAEGKRLKSERVFPGEIFVDILEAYDGKPHTFYRRKWVSKSLLQGKFKDKALEIEHVSGSGPEDSYGRAQDTDQVELLEIWRCGPSGYHILALEQVLLKFEPYKRVCPPLSFMRWTRPRRGFWGIGLIEELMPLHIDINLTLRQLQKNIKYGNFQVWLDGAGRAQSQKMTNEPGAINLYRGEKPSFVTVDPVSAGLINHLNSQIQRAYAMGGVSPDAVAGVNTLGADASGEARRAFNELQTARWALVEREWERMWMDSCQQYRHMAKMLSKKYGADFTVMAAKDRYTVDVVNWEDVDLDEEDYVIRVAPVSALPDLPSARLATVNDLYLMQLVDQAEARQLLDWPDLESHSSLDRAASDNIDRIIEKMLDEGQYEAPSPYQDHQLALKKMQSAYERACTMEVPESHKSQMRKFMAATAKFIQQAAIAQAGALPQGEPGMPMAPGPTGQSPTAVRPGDGTMS